jgi:hypothetical protein
VKILFDANTPAPLARFLRGHEVVRADELGWQGLENGALLDAAEQAEFDVLLTCDQNVRYQQNLASRKLALVILSSNHWPTLRRIAARIATASISCKLGRSSGSISGCYRPVGSGPPAAKYKEDLATSRLHGQPYPIRSHWATSSNTTDHRDSVEGPRQKALSGGRH